MIIASLFFYFCFIVFREKKGTIIVLLQKQAQKKIKKYKHKQTNKKETKNAAPFEKADGKIVEKEAR